MIENENKESFDGRAENSTSRSLTTTNNSDLPDSHHDEKRLEVEKVSLDLPDVEDIPGQENIIPPKMGFFADTTISSDDEEGHSVFGEEDEQVEGRENI